MEGEIMAYYKYPEVLTQRQDLQFDQAFHPGAFAPSSGIYRCEGCGREAVSTKDNPLPPQDHHQHTLQQGDIRWRLIVMSTHA